MSQYGKWEPIDEASDEDKRGCIVAAWWSIGNKWVVGEAHISNGQWFWANCSDGDYAAESLPSAGLDPRKFMPLPPPPSTEGE